MTRPSPDAEIDGWDTHVRSGTGRGTFAARLSRVLLLEDFFAEPSAGTPSWLSSPPPCATSTASMAPDAEVRSD